MSNLETMLVDSGPLLEATGLAHRVLEPAGPGPYRTVVMLHGRFGDEDAMWIFRRTIPATWLKIAPRALFADPLGGFSWVLQESGVWPEWTAFAPAVTAVTNFLEALPRLYNSDPAHTYLMGFSQGAAAAYATAVRHPGLARAIAGLVGFVPGGMATDRGLEGLRDVPVFTAVGTKDRLVPYEVAMAGVELLRQAGAALEHHEYDTGHKLNGAGQRDLTAWWGRR